MVSGKSKKQVEEIRAGRLIMPANRVAENGTDTDSLVTFEEKRINEIGRELLAEMREVESKAKRFDPAEKLMNWAMQDKGFKTQLFRFVDTLPVLSTSAQVYDYLVDFLMQPGVRLPVGMSTAMKAGKLFRPAMAIATRKQIEYMASKFIAGKSVTNAQSNLEKLWKKNIAFSVDLLGEECLSEEEADEYRKKYLEAICVLGEFVKGWSKNEVLEDGFMEQVPRANISIKISSLCARVDALDFEGSISRIMHSIDPILREAEKRNVLINFDMESYALKDLTIELFIRCCKRYDFTAGIAMQAYLQSAEKDAKKLIDYAINEKRDITVRLVKGAYWDYEVIHAQQMGWPIPVWENKQQTDASFERVAKQYIGAMPKAEGKGGIHLALGSHNVRSIASALYSLEEQGLPRHSIELQMLYGMADSLKKAAVNQGLRVREYVPVGDLLPGMAYLVRRLLENTSNESWLRSENHENVSDDVLLESPHVKGL